jgi:succinate-semialdehyde dehydrogenase/glutarate-semialdehyde dehydrogenase
MQQLRGVVLCMRAMATMSSSSYSLADKAYIGGKWVGSTRNFPVLNPSSGETIGHVPDLGPAEVAEAVAAAKGAFGAWSSVGWSRREVLLRRWGELMKENADQLAEIMTLESGKPLAESRGEVAYARSFITLYASLASLSGGGDIVPSSSSSQKRLALKEPVGVVSAITPFNFPAAMITRKVAPALAAGCTVIVKPAEDTPLTALALADLAEKAGIPPGVINVVTSSRERAQSVGELMCTHRDVRKISFTGSTAVGKILLAHAAGTVKNVSMELGGNAPFIVFEDANLDQAVTGIIRSRFRYGGQTCICTNRAIVHKSVAEEFAVRLAERTAQLKVGDGMSKDTDIGPLINARAVERVRALVLDAVSKGAVVHTGGPEPLPLGPLYFRPTVLTGANMSMDVCKQEIFGPVLPIITFDDEAEAIEVANSVPGGLAGYFYTQNMQRGFRVASALEVGMVGFNDINLSAAESPFGGVKEAGLGREGGEWGKYSCDILPAWLHQ